MDKTIIKPPPEPEAVKKALRALYEAQGGKAKYIVFAGNKLPKYLWDHWSEEMHRAGLRWQDLLRSLSKNSEKAMAWITGEASWEELVEAIISDLAAGASREKERTGARRKIRALTDFF